MILVYVVTSVMGYIAMIFITALIITKVWSRANDFGDPEKEVVAAGALFWPVGLTAFTVIMMFWLPITGIARFVKKIS